MYWLLIKRLFARDLAVFRSVVFVYTRNGMDNYILQLIRIKRKVFFPIERGGFGVFSFNML